MKNNVLNWLILFLCLAIPAITIPAAYFLLPAKLHFHVVQKYSLSSTELPARVKLGFILPKSGPYQEIKNTRINWNDQLEKLPSTYVDVYKLWGEMENEQTTLAETEYDIILTQGKVSWESPVELFHTLPQAGIESDHPVITDKASELSNNPNNIYQFTARHLTFDDQDYDCTSASGLAAYRRGSGTCEGYSRLMVALCRASGIPAQMVIGSVLPDIFFPLHHDARHGILGRGHAWVEYFSQGRWSIADPSWGMGYTSFLEFNRNDGHHLSYGEYDHLIEDQEQLSRWAINQSFLVDASLTHIITSSNDSTAVKSDIHVSKKFDGRWINTLLVFVLSTYLVCKIRDKFIQVKFVYNT